MSDLSPSPSQAADAAIHPAPVTPARENSIDGGWQMYDKNEHLSDDGPCWLSHSPAALESIERASFNKRTNNLLAAWDFSDVYIQHTPERTGSRHTSVKISRRSRPFLLNLFDLVVRAGGPLIILLAVISIVGGFYCESGRFAPATPISAERQPAYIEPSRPIIHTVKVHRIVKRMAPHQSLAANSHKAEIELSLPAATNVEHRHAYQTYR